MIAKNASAAPRVAARAIADADRESAGFTLIELMVVIIVIAILAAIAVPAFLLQRQGAWDSSAKADLANYRIAAAQYEEAQNGVYTGMTTAILGNSTYGFKASPDQPAAQWTLTIGTGGTSYTIQVYSDNYPSPGTGHRFTFSSATGTTTTS